jgi:hypothetical protein
LEGEAHSPRRPCPRRALRRHGEVRGEVLEGQATILADTTRVEALEARKYGLVYRVIRLSKEISHRLRRQPAPEEVTIEIIPSPEG